MKNSTRRTFPHILIRLVIALLTVSFIYRSKFHASLKRNYQLLPAAQWLKLLLAHIPDKYEHLVRYYGFYSNRARGERKDDASADNTSTLHLQRFFNSRW